MTQMCRLCDCKAKTSEALHDHATSCHVIYDKCNYITSTYKDPRIHQRIIDEDLSPPASDHSDCKIFEPSFENKNSNTLCDLISETILGLETHSKGQQHHVFPESHSSKLIYPH